MELEKWSISLGFPLLRFASLRAHGPPSVSMPEVFIKPMLHATGNFHRKGFCRIARYAAGKSFQVATK